MTDEQPKPPTYWLSYGGGVNSTALAVLLCHKKLPQYDPWRILFADTMDEQEATYEFIHQLFVPFLRRYGRTLEICRDSVGVLERAERYNFTLSRQYRSCTENGKVMPVRRHIKAHGQPNDAQLIGIDAGESHRAKGGGEKSYPRFYPLIDLDYDREDCERIIRDAGLPIPPKSGCWHCPFMRVPEVIKLAQEQPCRFDRIVRLEELANKHHPGESRTTWNDRPASWYRERALRGENYGELFADQREADPPCGCYDG